MVSAWLIPALTSVSAGWGGRWAAGFLLPLVTVAPATWAMGATLPAVESLVATWRDDGRRVGPLYAANTAGAAIGVVASIWLLQPWLGLRLATVCLSTIHLLCAAGFLSGVRSLPQVRSPLAIADVSAIPAGRRLRWTLAATGFLGIGFEVLATRLLGQIFENTVYSHAVVLVVYLGGTAVGAGLRNRWIRDPVASLPWLLLAQAGVLALSGYLMVATSFWHPALRAAFGDGATGNLMAELLSAVAIVGTPTILMGMLFSSLAQRAASGRGSSLGRGVGWNLLGGAIAPVIVGAAWIPWLGSRSTLMVLSAGYLLLLPRVRGFQWLALAAVLGWVALLPRGLHLQQIAPSLRFVSIREGPGDTVTVVESADGSRALRVNNRFTMGGTASTNAERRHAHIPVLLHPDPHRVLFLGVGTGISFAALDQHPGLTADGVELVPEIVASMPAFAPHNVAGPKLTLRVADARRFVRAARDPYDVVIADLFHPARDGAGALYTREHFTAIRAVLGEDGIFCQWLPLFQLDLPTLRTITRTFLEVFPESDAFLLRFTADTPVLGLVGTRRPLRFDQGWFERRTGDAGLREALRPLGLTDSLQLFGTWFAGRNWLEQLAAGAPLNTDDRPVVLFEAPHTLEGRGTVGWTLLQQLLDRPRPFPEAPFQGTRDVDRVWRDRLFHFHEARDLYLRGLIADATGQRAEAVDAFVGSARLSAEFTTGYAQVLARAAQVAKSDPALARSMLERLSSARPERTVAEDLRRRLGL